MTLLSKTFWAAALGYQVGPGQSQAAEGHMVLAGRDSRGRSCVRAVPSKVEEAEGEELEDARTRALSEEGGG